MIKRFYREAIAIEEGAGWQVRLDGKGVKTANGAAQIVPNADLANMLAGEWNAQGDVIDPASFVLRDHADYTIDIVRADRDEAIGKLLAFAETDTLCYRADPDDALFERQQQVWEPILTAFEAREKIVLHRISGIIHRNQPTRTMDALRLRLTGLDDFTLAGLQVLTSLAASLTVGLSVLEPGSEPASLWAAANLEEEWQADLWGRDDDAELLRTRRGEEFRAALQFVRLAQPTQSATSTAT